MSSLTLKQPLWTVRIAASCCRSRSTVTVKEQDKQEKKEKFRVLKIPGVHDLNIGSKKRAPFRAANRPPRFQKMKTDQDWTNVWPTATTFKWSAVPFPVRQGHVKNMAENEGFIPDKYGNVELMKIPNFLHLTPPHIVKQCAALKELCTPWPKGLTKDKIEELFPLKSISSDYCFASNKIRDPRARTVTVKFKVAQLNLDSHAEKKFSFLVGDRLSDGEVTLTSDRCPLKMQNFDYIMYLLTVLYHESKIKEPWEDEIEPADRTDIIWRQPGTKERLGKLLTNLHQLDKQENLSEEDKQSELDRIMNSEKFVKFENMSLTLMNTEETEDNLNQYKSSVMELLGIPKFEDQTSKLNKG